MRFLPVLALIIVAPCHAGETVPLFDGKTLAGWEENLDWFRVADGSIVAGKLDQKIPRNEFLCTDKDYGDFELRLKFKVIGRGANAGVQFRSRRIPNHHEVKGYQADLGDGWWGRALRRVAAQPHPGAAQARGHQARSQARRLERLSHSRRGTAHSTLDQ